MKLNMKQKNNTLEKIIKKEKTLKLVEKKTKIIVGN